MSPSEYDDDWMSCDEFFDIHLKFGDGTSARRLAVSNGEVLYVADNAWDTIDNDPNYAFRLNSTASTLLRKALSHFEQGRGAKAHLVIHEDGREELEEFTVPTNGEANATKTSRTNVGSGSNVSPLPTP